MKLLSEMVKKLEQYQYPNSLQIIGKIKETPTQISRFYEGIRKGNLTSDEVAAQAILNCSSDKQVYKDLKSKLRNRILNTVFFINPKKLKVDSLHNKTAIHCHKRWTAAKILHTIGAINIAVEIANQVLIQARKAEISHLVTDIALYLRFQSGALKGDQKKFEHYNQIFHHHKKIRDWEDKAQEYYIQLALYYVKSKAEKSAIHEKAKSFYEELEDAIYEYKTYKLAYFGGLIKLVIPMSINDYETAAEVCKETITLLDANPLNSSMGKAVFIHQQLICCIQLKRFEEGEALATKALKYLKPGFYNWFKHQELYFLLSTHTKNYQRAYEVLTQTIDTRGYNSLDDNSKEVWRIYDMYTKYLISQGKIDVPKGQEKKVRLGKFLNEVPSYSQDKRGLNIAILIIQILFYVQRKDYDSAISRIKAIEKYCSRYLKRDNDFRNNCFIKMILQLPLAHFHPAAALRKADKLYSRLKSQPIDPGKQAHSIEIIPYEDLWEIAIGSLERRGWRKRL